MADLGDPPAGVLDPGFAKAAAAGRAITLPEYMAAMNEREALGTHMSRFHAEWDLLVTPTLPIPAFTAGRDVPEGWPDEHWQSWTPFTYPFNLTQQPAATVPCGFTARDCRSGCRSSARATPTRSSCAPRAPTRRRTRSRRTGDRRAVRVRTQAPPRTIRTLRSHIASPIPRAIGSLFG